MNQSDKRFVYRLMKNGQNNDGQLIPYIPL